MGGEIGGESDDEVDNLDDSVLSNFVPVVNNIPSRDVAYCG